jgi:peptide/nickel transport system permease protein
MTADTPSDRFEDVDWDEVSGQVTVRSPTQWAALIAFGVVALALVYDAFILSSGPTFDFTVAGFEYVWDVTAVDWLFVTTLLVLFFYAVVPLAQNPRMTAYYWKEFRKNKPAVVSLGFLLVIFFVGTVGTIFIQPPELNVIASYQPPVFMSVDASVPSSCVGEVTNGQCQGTWEYPLGTTGDGKGILKMVIFGMRVSMQVGLIAMLISIFIATLVGATAAYAGGWVDEVLMRYVDIQLTFPTFFLFLFLAYLYGGSLFILIMIFGVTGWGGIARIIRSEALQRNEEEYIRAAQSAGASGLYVVRRHMVPNVSNSIITAATLNIPILILSEAALSFIGVGDVTVPSWGQVIASGRGDLSTAWWISTIPGVFLFLTILAFNFLGDALRDALDPRQETQ